MRTRQFLSILLCTLLIGSALPTGVYAAGNAAADRETVEAAEDLIVEMKSEEAADDSSTSAALEATVKSAAESAAETVPETEMEIAPDNEEETVPETVAETAPDTAEEAMTENDAETGAKTAYEAALETADEAVPETAEETAPGASDNPTSEKTEPDATKTVEEKASGSGKGEAEKQEKASEGSSGEKEVEEGSVSEKAPEEVSEGSAAGKAGEEASEETEKTTRTFRAFKQKQKVNGITVTVSADAGVFPEDAVLFVTEVPASEVEAAIGEVREDGVNVASSYTFDIKVLDADGHELQPADSQSVKVSFHLAEAADENLEAKVWHISGDESQGTLSAEELETDSEGQTVTAQTDGFSYYTVEFTYGDLQYVLPGKKSVPLSVILDTVGLVGTATAVTVSDETLFSASRENGEWAVTSHQPFSTTEKMSVTIEGIEYEITVTDYHGTLYYYDENGQRIKLSEWFHIESSDDNDSSFTWNDNGFNQYVVHAGENVTYDRRIDVKNDVILILGVGATLTIKGGIHVGEGNSLTIYQQEQGTGKLIIQDVDLNNAGIGGNILEACGNVRICGGTIEVTGGRQAAGIGGGTRGNGGHIMITGGTVNAYSGERGAGIGGGSGNSNNHSGNGGTITITGGTVRAISTSSSYPGAGIGGGWYCDGGTIMISGGTVTAEGSAQSACIGGGEYGGGGTVTITGGTVTAFSGASGSPRGQAIGHGNVGLNIGNLTLGDTSNGSFMRVGIVNGDSVDWVDAAARESTCRKDNNVTIRIEPCTTHEGTAYIDNHDGTHTVSCKYCGSPDKTESHTYTDGVCICGAEELIYTVTVEGGTADISTAKAGDTVTITADDPEEGYAYVQWALNSGVSFAQTDGFTTTFTMPNHDVTVKAVFKEITPDPLYDQVYTGKAFEPTFGLFGMTLEGVDAVFPDYYDLSYADNVDVGEAKVTVTFKEPYVGHKTVTFNILPADLSTASVEAEDQEYDGREQRPDPTVTWNGKTLEKDKDYTVTYKDNLHAGKASVTVTGKGNFADTTSAGGTFMINKRPLTITAKGGEYVYNGKPQGEDDMVYEDPAVISEKTSAEGLADGDALSAITLNGQETDADVYDDRILPSNARINDDDRVTASYVITYKPGTLTIKPAKAAITVDDASKALGGKDPDFTGKVDGLFADGDLGEIKYLRIGSDESAGTYKGVLTAQYTENKNYDVTVINGDFTIKQLFTLKWLDGDGSILQEKTHVDGEEPPVFDGKKPARAETAQYTYEFSGWDNGTIDGTTTTYKPIFDEIVKQYTVTFVDYDGKTILKEAAPYDYGTPADQISLPDEPKRKADAEYSYTFTGWTPKITDVTKEAVYTAVYSSEKQSYKITWLQDDGSLIDETMVEYGETPVHADPSKEADAQYTYIFAGWDPEITEVSGTAAYKATYSKTVNQYTVTFVDYDGKTILKETAAYDYGTPADQISLPDEPKREADAEYSYTFTGWTPEIADVTGNAVYTAVYSSDKQTYKITWLQDDGSLIDETTVEYGETPVHTDPSKDADAQYTYTFAGWDPEITEVTGEATYKAIYRKTPVPAKKATLTFDLAGGTLAGRTGSITIEANVGDTIKLPGIPTRTGYTFQYWKGSEYKAGADYTVKGDHTFTAEWEKEEEKEEKGEEKEKEEGKIHIVTFNSNGHGRAPAARTVEEGKMVSRPEDPTVDGYIFGGWFTDRECRKAFDFNTAITKDVTLYAKWTKKNSSGSDGSSKKNTTKSSTTKSSTTKSSATTGSKSGSSSSGSRSKSPTTGDDNRTGMWLILAVASLLGLILAAIKKKQS